MEPRNDKKIALKNDDGFRAEDVKETGKEMEGTSAVTEKEIAEESRGSFMEIELPLGFLDQNGTVHDVAIIREMTGEEEDILVSGVSVSRKINRVISNCIEEIRSKDGKHVLKDRKVIEDAIVSIPSADRMYLLIKIRQQSYGEFFKFEATCPNMVETDEGSRECENKQVATVNLNDLKVTIPVDKKKRMFECVLPSSKKKIVFKVMTGREDSELARIKKNEEKSLSEILMMRVISINGSPPSVDSMKKMSIRDRKFLRDQMEKADEAGLDTKIEIECTKCKHKWTQTLRMDSADFFFPEGQ